MRERKPTEGVEDGVDKKVPRNRRAVSEAKGSPKEHVDNLTYMVIEIEEDLKSWRAS